MNKCEKSNAELNVMNCLEDYHEPLSEGGWKGRSAERASLSLNDNQIPHFSVLHSSSSTMP